MLAAMKSLNEENRYEDMRVAAEQEFNIEEYKVQPVTNQCMTDFFTFSHPQIDDIEVEVCGQTKYGVKPEEVPLNYYDNDDGYWDNYIRYKHTRAEQAGMITKRMYFIH